MDSENDSENAEIENGLTQNNLENLEYTFYWFKKAAENENTYAQYNLAHLYMTGE